MMKPRREYQRQLYVPAAAQPMIAKAFAVAAERGESFSAVWTDDLQAAVDEEGAS